MRGFKFFYLASILAVTAVGKPLITLQNNQPFLLLTPIRIPGAGGERELVTDHGIATQSDGGDLILVADLPAETQVPVNVTPGKPAESKTGLTVEPIDGGIGLNFEGNGLGQLSWQLDVHSVPAIKGETNEPTNFDVMFIPATLSFHKIADGPVFSKWTAETEQGGLEMKLNVVAYTKGLLGVTGSVTNRTADPKVKSYAAVICRWEQFPVSARTLCYDNHISAFGEKDLSPNRSGPQGSQTFKQRGADWVLSTFKNSTSAVWLNDFAPSFAVVDNSRNNPHHAPRYANANLSQLGQEFQTVPGKLYSITEIARSDTRTFHDRFTENLLPAQGEGVTFGSRIRFDQRGLAPEEADHAFVGYTSYNSASKGADGLVFSFGAPSVRFGTSYFPYSTLGENFDQWKLPGMDSESFWPLAADTVLQWRLFADDIRRDLRIAKGMGFELIRFHHLELLAAIPSDIRREYLDFLFDELRHLHLRALVDVNASPAQLTDLVGRCRDVIDGVEIENEVLIWGIPLDRPPQWKAMYDAVKKVAPEIPINFTGYNNTGMFDKLRELGVPFDRVDLHSYIDNVDAMPSGRGYALALGSYASKGGKPPMISEWNWRGLTRMSEEKRAKIYAPVIENAVATRAIPDFYQFQFNETLAPNPRTGRGSILRHYELLNLSRRPKAEAFELMNLIHRYGAATNSYNVIRSDHPVVELNAQNKATLQFSITNTAGHRIQLHAVSETFGGMDSRPTTNEFTLEAQSHMNFPVAVALTNRAPGFYHVFVRLESKDGLVDYLWGEVRAPGVPRVEDGTAVPFDFSRPVSVVYSAKASALEVETAFAVGQTLESATGRVVPILPMEEMTQPGQSHLIYVGVDKSAPAAGRDWFLITGKNTRAVEDAGMEFVLRYWKFAKDSAARRVGLARKELPLGSDASKLP